MIRTTILGQSCETDCIGCSIIHGNLHIPGGVIFEGKHFILHQDPEIPIVGFLIITAKRHVKFVNELVKEEIEELFTMLSFTMNSLKSNEENIIEHTFIFEERSCHLHLLIFPRLEWMSNYPNSISSIRKIMASAKENINIEVINNILLYVDEMKCRMKLAGQDLQK